MSTVIKPTDSPAVVHKKIAEFADSYVELVAGLLISQGRFATRVGAKRNVRKAIIAALTGRR